MGCKDRDYKIGVCCKDSIPLLKFTRIIKFMASYGEIKKTALLSWNLNPAKTNIEKQLLSKLENNEGNIKYIKS